MLMLKIVVMTLMALLFSGCVGTVQDTAEPFTQIAAKPKTVIHFGGIYQAVPIAHDKIEIFFYPATGGSTKYFYTFYVGDRPIPYTVPSETLTADYRGLLKFTIAGLDPAKTYIAKANAVDQTTGEPDSNVVTARVTTFGNLVADFNGISGVYNTAGVEGIDSINVRWSHATIDYTNITGSAATDPDNYEIVAVDSDRLTPADMDKTNFTAVDGRHVKIFDYDPLENETILRGLKSRTKYYVRVRTLHRGSIDDLNAPELRGEKNSTYLTITTLDSDLANIKNLETLATSKNPGIAQSTSLILSWTAVTGVYDHLRLIYTVSPNPIYIEEGASCGVKPDAEISCRKIFGGLVSTIVGNLTPGETYRFQLVACQDAECNINKSGPIITGDTFPTFAGFSGIQSVDIAETLQDIGKIFLKIPLPDFTIGDFDGYVIGFKTNLDPTYTEISEVGHATMTIEDYNHRTDSMITISGVDYGSGGLYCFSVYPFVYNGDGSKNAQPNDVWKCNVPEILPPDIEQFQGLSDASAFGYSILLGWSEPANGIYESYELYMRKTPGAFSFSEAKSQVASGLLVDYEMVVLPWFVTTYTFSNLPPKTYKVGIITRYIYGSQDIFRSEDNDKKYDCMVDGAVDGSGNFVLAACTNGI